MEGGKREEAGQSSGKCFIIDDDDQEDLERNEVIGDFVHAPPVPLKDQLEKDKDDESLNRWKEKLLGCVESDLNGQMDPEVIFHSIGILSNDFGEIITPLPVEKIQNGHPLFTLKEGSEYRLKLTFTVHSRGKSLAKDVDFDKVARRTPGFTGADLQNLMNEVAILTASRDLKEINKDEIADALERIIASLEKKNAVVLEEKKKLVAYHEAGHALVGALMPEYDPVAKISIIPRGQAGGLTFFAPSEERLKSGLYSKSYLENQMAVALGGRVAEEVIFGKENVTTGASNDFIQVSRVARQMVERFGFSKKIGQVAVGGSGGDLFLGQQMSSQKDYSMATADVVDSELRELVSEDLQKCNAGVLSYFVQKGLASLEDAAVVATNIVSLLYFEDLIFVDV